MQVPTRVFVTDALPKGPTGKISRRHMVDAFMKEGELKSGCMLSLMKGTGVGCFG